MKKPIAAFILLLALLCLAPSPGLPTPDPLAIPVLPDHPTPVERGRVVYYYNCMPCHGDVGQGLTDEWRAVWEEDHQNCWARGCHAGRPGEEGFPLPHTIPAVDDPARSLGRFGSPAGLLAYLQATHPPQNPGVLAPGEYDSVAALLLSGETFSAAEQNAQVAARTADSHESSPLLSLAAFAAAVLIVALALIRQSR